MHKAGKVIFRITNGSAFFVLETFPLNANGFLWTLKTVMRQHKMKQVTAVSGHVHTATISVLIQIGFIVILRLWGFCRNSEKEH